MKAFAGRSLDALVGEQVPHVEQIARMLAVERRDDLAGIEVGKANDLDFRKAELLFHARRETVRVSGA